MKKKKATESKTKEAETLGSSQVLFFTVFSSHYISQCPKYNLSSYHRMLHCIHSFFFQVSLEEMPHLVGKSISDNHLQIQEANPQKVIATPGSKRSCSLQREEPQCS